MKIEIIVGNIGTVYTSENRHEAARVFAEYYHAKYGEPITLWQEGEPCVEYDGETPLYEICDYGIDNSQYFQGHGCSYTRFNVAETGCGSDVKEAIDDVLENIAMNDGGPLVDVVVACIEADPELQITDEVAEKHSVRRHLIDNGEMTEDGDMPDMCELYYYVGVRY